jgi:hypothetical protein
MNALYLCVGKHLKMKNIFLYILFGFLCSSCATEVESGALKEKEQSDNNDLSVNIQEEIIYDINADSLAELVQGTWVSTYDSNIVYYATDKSTAYLVDLTKNLILGKTRFQFSPIASEQKPKSYFYSFSCVNQNGDTITKRGLDFVKFKKNALNFSVGGGFRHWQNWIFEVGLTYENDTTLTINVSDMEYSFEYFEK